MSTIIPANRIPELIAESERLSHEILALEKRRDGIEFSLYQSGEARLRHVHVWVETEISCEDCGSHPALRCDSQDDECPVLIDLGIDEYLDLVRYDDPREEESK